MHIDLLSITFLTINDCRHEHQCVFSHEISYASFSSCVCCQIKFECRGEGQDGEREEGEKKGLTCHGRQGGEDEWKTANSRNGIDEWSCRLA